MHTEVEPHFFAVTKTDFIGNTATKAGGAVFTNSPEAIDVCCDCDLHAEEKISEPVGIDKRPGITEVKRLASVGIIGSDNPCEQTWVDNVAELQGGGNVFATSAKSMKVCKTSTGECVDGATAVQIWNHSSGHDLEPITIELIDAFDHPAFGPPDMQIRVDAAANVVLSGQKIVEVGVNTSLDSIRMQAQVGQTHNLTVSFAPSILSNITLQVQVRQCVSGEMLHPSGERCDTCGEGLYSFNPLRGCIECPSSNARCNGSTITPNDQFWHFTSQSVNIHKCFIRTACEYENRTMILQRQAREAHASNVTLSYDDGYQQCAMVRVDH